MLDVRCGPGTITADLAERVTPGSVVGIDTSAEVVAAAVRDHAAANLSFRIADIYRLDDPESSFDIVHAHQVLQHLADSVAALVEMRRVCRREGTIAVRDCDYAAMTWWPDTPGLERWHNMYRTVARANGWGARRRPPPEGLGPGRGPDRGDRLGVGLVLRQPWRRSWWADTWAQRTTNSPLAERAVELGVASPDELAACAKAWHTWASHPDAWFVVVHGEILASA